MVASKRAWSPPSGAGAAGAETPGAHAAARSATADAAARRRAVRWLEGMETLVRGGGGTDRTAPAAPPAAWPILAGDGQTAAVPAQLDGPLRVRVTDADGRAVRNREVRFEVLSGGGSVNPGALLTDRDGVAETRWTLGTVAGGTQRVAARVTDGAGGVLASATFRAVAQAGDP